MLIKTTRVFMAWFDDTFGFSRREKRGILVLSVLIVMSIVANAIIYHIRVASPYNFSDYEKEIDKLMETVKSDSVAQPVELYFFDPNLASKEELIALGIPPKVAGNIVNYRNKGGKFRKPADLARMYGLDTELFERIEPFLVFPENEDKNYQSREEARPVYFEFDPNTATADDFKKMGVRNYVASNIVRYREKGGQFRNKTDLLNIYGFDSLCYQKIEPYIKITTQFAATPEKALLELNTATLSDLDALKGIGEAYANRIISYRTKLGGFVNVVQLKEVYGMSDELYQSLTQQVMADPGKVNCINVNTADYKTLISHPYLEKAETTAILSYREMVGKIQHTDELLKQKVLSEDVFRKIKPYLCTE